MAIRLSFRLTIKITPNKHKKQHVPYQPEPISSINKNATELLLTFYKLYRIPHSNAADLVDVEEIVKKIVYFKK